jgi:hypothetical protein
LQENCLRDTFPTTVDHVLVLPFNKELIMKSGYRIMDSDMHLREPANLWDKSMEPEWRDQAPKILARACIIYGELLVEVNLGVSHRW